MVSSAKAEPQNVVLWTNETTRGFFFGEASNSRDFYGECFYRLRREILHNFAQNFDQNGLLEPSLEDFEIAVSNIQVDLPNIN